MCADNGIVEESVSQSGQEVTVAVAKSMGKGKSCVGQMAKAVGVDTIPVDIGINLKETIHGLVSRKIRCGTRNFSKEPAMLEIILDLIVEPALAIWDLIGLILERLVSGKKSKMYPLEDVGPVTEEEILRDKLEDFAQDLNRRP